MSKWEKVKEFYEENKAMIRGFAIMSGLFAYGIGMYAYGINMARRADEISLSMCIAAKPELKPMLEEAIKKLEETVR